MLTSTDEETNHRLNPVTDFYAKLIEEPIGSPEHVRLRDALPVYQCGMFSCQYFLSMLEGRDYFVTCIDEFAERLRGFVAEKASPRSLEFDSAEFDEFVVPFMQKQFEDRFFTRASRMSKEERGMVTLIEHPEWSDEQIRQSVNTTHKQMTRWRWYRRARAVQGWNTNRAYRYPGPV